MGEKKVVQTIPLWLAVAITVVVGLPLAVFLGDYNIALWVSFITWAEYFALGAKPEVLKLIVPLFPLGSLTMAVFATFTNYSVVYLGWDLLISVTIWIFIWVAIAVYIMRFHPNFWKGSLAYFNGLTMYLALYFANVKPGFGAGPLIGDPLLDPWILWVWVSIAGLFGGFLGWFNLTITFPREVSS